MPVYDDIRIQVSCVLFVVAIVCFLIGGAVNVNTVEHGTEHGFGWYILALLLTAAAIYNAVS